MVKGRGRLVKGGRERGRKKKRDIEQRFKE
jgi:hypothetical protein